MYFANLPWYDLPEIRFATDLLWSRLAENLRGQGFLRVPSNLDRVTSYRKQWASEKLIFSQACGYDVVLPYADHLRALATPVYNALGCRGAYYSSFVTVHLDSPVEHLADLRGSRCVINEVTSHSGMNSIRAMIAGMHRNGRFFSEILVSGSHELSLKKIARKEADVAAIDCITYALLKRHRPDLVSRTRVLFCTGHVPAPPYVVSSRVSDDDEEKIRAALMATLEEPVIARAKEYLLLDRVERLSLDSYRPIAEWESEASNLGYTEMSTYRQHSSTSPCGDRSS